MAKKKTARKKTPMKEPGIGHNADNGEDMDELRKIAKAQRTLDKEMESTRKDWTERKRNLTARLEKVGKTREQFKEPYDHFCKIADAKDDAEARKAKEDRKVFLAQQRVIYDALGQGDSIDWVDLIQDADEIRALREEEEQKAAEEAAAAASDAEETPAEI